MLWLNSSKDGSGTQEGSLTRLILISGYRLEVGVAQLCGSFCLDLLCYSFPFSPTGSLCNRLLFWSHEYRKFQLDSQLCSNHKKRSEVWICFQDGKSQRSGLRVMKSQKIQANKQTIAQTTALWFNKTDQWLQVINIGCCDNMQYHEQNKLCLIFCTCRY